MCGIAGFTHRGSVSGEDRIGRAIFSLTHRGPDQQGYLCAGDADIGAVRLKIIDLEGGDQPMATDDGDTVIAFNGEIYNYRELRRDLEGRGHRFHSQCDTEVVLHAFLEWDTGCFARLRGMFAAALWNRSAKRLVLARDRLGIKPLYYHLRGQNLYFASELKALFVHPEIERRLDLAGLNYFLSLNYVPTPYTLVEGVLKVPPAHWLEWSDGRLRMERYWRLQFAPRPRTLETAAEELDALLHNAVRDHLVSDVPLGVWASGGLDSSTILHYAAAHSPGPLKTFSISFQGRSFDESPYFRQVAAQYGTEHHEADLNPSLDLAGAVEEIAYYSDEPSADAGALPVWFLSRMSREHVTVALSGEGADELFGGYLTYRADRWARVAALVPAPARRLLLRGVQRWPVSDDKIGLEYKVKRFLEGSLLEPDQAHCHWNGAFSSSEKRSFYHVAQCDGLAALFRSLPLQADAGLNRYLCFDQMFYLPDDILYKCDRMSMAHSLEVRPPFLDHRIAEFAASLPEDLKIRGRNQKFLLRKLMRDKLPASVLKRKKEGFDIPAHEWLRGPLKPLLLETLSAGAIERARIFEPRAIEDLLRSHLERRANLGFHLWGLLILFLWMKRWKIDAGAAEEAPRTTLETAAAYAANSPS